MLTLSKLLIICPLLFLAGFIDAIGGGGGLISLPAYMLAGLPIHSAVATNKLSSTCGTTLSTIRFIKNRLINFKLALPAVLSAIVGSSIGAKLSLFISENILSSILLILMPIIAFIVLNKKLFKDNNSDTVNINVTCIITIIISSLVIGIYDGLYGPGTGTLLIITYTVFAKMNVRTANAQAKLINLTTNITSLVIFVINGQVIFHLGIIAALFNMAGNYIGSGLVLKKDMKIIKPVIILVLIILTIKLIFNL